MLNRSVKLRLHYSSQVRAATLVMLAFASAVPVPVLACNNAAYAGLVPCPDEKINKTTQKTTTYPDSLTLRDARLNYTQRTQLEKELATVVKQMVELYHSEYPSTESQPKIEVLGYINRNVATNIASHLRTAITVRDISKIIGLVKSQYIAPTFELDQNGTVLFSSSLESSANFRLEVAIKYGNAETVAKILTDESPDLERYGVSPELLGVPPLLQAVAAGQIEITDLLLRAGAHPDTRNRGQSTSPLFRAMYDSNDALVDLLARAGANLDTLIGTDNRMSPIAYAMSENKLPMALLLIEQGADPDVADYTGWTALMDALFAEQIDAIEELIVVTDPLLLTTQAITRGHRTKHLNRRYFPRTNALYIAWQMASPRKDDIAEALIKRARIVDPEWGEAVLRMQAGRSAADAAIYDGKPKEAIDRLREALSVTDISAFTVDVPGPAIVLAMESLTDLHELLLIDGRDFSATERSQVALIESFGGWHGKLHEMLDAIAQAQTSYPSERLERWRLAYGKPNHKDWDFTRLNNWVESMDDEAMQNRLFDTIDFFELNWHVRHGTRGVVR